MKDLIIDFGDNYIRVTPTGYEIFQREWNAHKQRDEVRCVFEHWVGRPKGRPATYNRPLTKLEHKRKYDARKRAERDGVEWDEEAWVLQNCPGVLPGRNCQGVV